MTKEETRGRKVVATQLVQGNTYRDRLVYLRTNEGLSQGEMAAKVGCSPRTYFNFEKGNTDLGVMQVLIILRLWNLNADWFLHGNGAMMKEIG